MCVCVCVYIFARVCIFDRVSWSSISRSTNAIPFIRWYTFTQHKVGDALESRKWECSSNTMDTRGGPLKKALSYQTYPRLHFMRKEKITFLVAIVVVSLIIIPMRINLEECRTHKAILSQLKKIRRHSSMMQDARRKHYDCVIFSSKENVSVSMKKG